ncbi:MAG TPA: sulfite exporter TauE/SafE family protein [Vicinamibacterales bacterium]|nr:sulfite exporter TauE/SafE family protein [Vicinamibacterales bacterium]
MSAPVLELIAITLFAAIVNGGLGYGFSSITVPLALLFLTNRVLNPALVLIEVVLNAWVLWVNRDALGVIWKRMLPIVIGLVPGVIVGTMIVTNVGSSWLKLWTYLLLLPLILFQAAGFRRPIKSERAIGLPFGFSLGILYSMTTISGPPLALLLNNQGLQKREFRASLGFIRLAESSFTAIAYLTAGLITKQSNLLIPQILPSVLIGVPIGAALVKQMKVETFRRICMSFDAWIVGFGVSTVLRDTRVVAGPGAYLFLLGVILIDGVLLYRFFSNHGRFDLARTS